MYVCSVDIRIFDCSCAAFPALTGETPYRFIVARCRSSLAAWLIAPAPFRRAPCGCQSLFRQNGF